MRIALIANGKVDNIIEAESIAALREIFPDFELIEAADASIGDIYDGLKLLPAPSPAVNLAALKADAIAKTYRDVDAVYDAAVGRRTTEYQKAEEDARAYREAGYIGDVSTRISKYAEKNPTGQPQTNQWAADQIIARADAFHEAEDSMRDVRFDCQAAMRAATSAEELATAVAAWNTFVAEMRQTLGL